MLQSKRIVSATEHTIHSQSSNSGATERTTLGNGATEHAYITCSEGLTIMFALQRNKRRASTTYFRNPSQIPFIQLLLANTATVPRLGPPNSVGGIAPKFGGPRSVGPQERKPPGV